MQLKMGHWGSAPYSMNTRFYPLGSSTRHPQDSWNSLGNTARILDSAHPGSNSQGKPGRTKVWSTVSVTPKDWPVPQSCFPRNWGKIQVKKELKSGNILWDGKFVKKGGKCLLLGEMLRSLGALEFEIKCSQIDLISTFCPLKQALHLIEAVTNWPLQGSHRSCPKTAFFCGLFWMFSGLDPAKFGGSSWEALSSLNTHCSQQKRRHSVSLRNRLLYIKGCNHFKAWGSYVFSSPAYWCRT